MPVHDVGTAVKAMAEKLGIDSAEVKRHLAYIGVSKKDIRAINNLREKMGDLPKEVIDDFYDHLYAFEETRRFLKNENVINNLKKKQNEYFKTLLEGRYDVNYFLDRMNVGHTHHIIGLETKWFVGAYVKFAEGLIHSLRKYIKVEQLEDTISALIKLIFIDVDLALNSYFFAREERISALHRLYTVLSNINQMITSAKQREELFKGVCHIAVTHGNFLFAWIGIVDPASGMVLPVEYYGKDGYSETIGKIRVKGRLSGEREPTGIAIKRGEIVVSQMKTGGKTLPRERNARKHGYGSCVAVPLKIGGKVVGALTIYAEEPDSFDNEKEIALMKEVGGDISFALDQIEKSKKIDYLSSHDPVTDLPTSELYITRLSNALLHAKHERKILGAILIDIDRYKIMRSTLGDANGNKLIKEVAGRLKASIRFGDTIARLSTTEIGIILLDVSREEDISSKVLANKILNNLSKPVVINGEELKITVSIGIATYPHDGEDAETLIRNARAALIKAREGGGNQCAYYSPELGEKIYETLKFETKLRKALEKDDFIFYYQPKIDLRSGKISGMEALIRWHDPGIGMVSPGKFVPILEESGMILEVGKRNIIAVCKQINEWKKKGYPPTRISVNVSPIQFMQENFVEELAKMLKREKIDPEYFEIEITERTIMEGVEETIKKLKRIKDMGMKISVDDFGTGYSSLSYLRHLPISTLKIDISFVRDMTKDPNTLAIVNTIITLAHNLDLTVVAEGVETQEQLNILKLLKCEEVQGFYFSPAVSAEKMGAFLSGGIPPKAAS